MTTRNALYVVNGDLALSLKKLNRAKTADRAIWALDVPLVLYASMRICGELALLIPALITLATFRWVTHTCPRCSQPLATAARWFSYGPPACGHCNLILEGERRGETLEALPLVANSALARDDAGELARIAADAPSYRDAPRPVERPNRDLAAQGDLGLARARAAVVVPLFGAGALALSLALWQTLGPATLFVIPLFASAVWTALRSLRSVGSR